MLVSNNRVRNDRLEPIQATIIMTTIIISQTTLGFVCGGPIGAFAGLCSGIGMLVEALSDKRPSAASRNTQPNNNTQRTASATHGIFQIASIPPLRLPSEVGEQVIDNISPPISGRSC